MDLTVYDTATLIKLHIDNSTSYSERDNFLHWCDANHLIFNVKKTEEMVFDPWVVGNHSPVIIYNTPINQVCSSKYFGVDNMYLEGPC